MLTKTFKEARSSYTVAKAMFGEFHLSPCKQLFPRSSLGLASTSVPLLPSHNSWPMSSPDPFSLCRHNRVQQLKELLPSIDIEIRDPKGNTLLLIACQNGLKKIAKICIKAGSNIDAINLMGNTALHFSFMYVFQPTYFILQSSPLRSATLPTHQVRFRGYSRATPDRCRRESRRS